MTEDDFDKLFDDDSFDNNVEVKNDVSRRVANGNDDDFFFDDIDDTDLVTFTPVEKRPKVWYFIFLVPQFPFF